jgi:N-acetylmuramoyl-L-alanine amidase
MFAVGVALSLAGAAGAQEWKLEKCPTPLWLQPGERLEVVLTGPPGQGGWLAFSDGSARVSLAEVSSGRYVASLRAPAEDEEALLVVQQDDKAVELGQVEVLSRKRLFTAGEMTVTRQGPDSDYERLTPLVAGARVPVDGRRGDWYRSAASGAWLDGGTGTVSDAAAEPSALSRIMIGETAPGGDVVLTLSCGSLPEAQVDLGPDGSLTVTLPGSDDLIFDVTRPSGVARAMGPVTVHPLTPHGTVIQIGRGARDIGGYSLRPGKTPGDLELRVGAPVPSSLAGLAITIDAGHGGPLDPGTVGHGGLAEKELNLRVAKALEKILRERGATVNMTRESDSDVADHEEGATHELQARVDATERAASDLFISVHHNARPTVEEGKTSHGTDVYWYQPFSEPLARALADPVADAIAEPARTWRFRSFHVIRQTYCPSVLIEFEYLSNPEMESNVLTQPDYPEKAAAGVVRGLEAYLRALH